MVDEARAIDERYDDCEVALLRRGYVPNVASFRYVGRHDPATGERTVPEYEVRGLKLSLVEQAAHPGWLERWAADREAGGADGGRARIIEGTEGA